MGHRVIGVDVNLDKVECLSRGRPPIIEDRGGELTAGGGGGDADCLTNPMRDLL